VPSRSEGFGLPALEAMARGCPVVASDAGALPEVVGDAGLLVPPGDPDALAAVLDRLLTDDSLATSLGAAGHRRAATFTWSACSAPPARRLRRSRPPGRGRRVHLPAGGGARPARRVPAPPTGPAGRCRPVARACRRRPRARRGACDPARPPGLGAAPGPGAGR